MCVDPGGRVGVWLAHQVGGQHLHRRLPQRGGPLGEHLMLSPRRTPPPLVSQYLSAYRLISTPHLTLSHVSRPTLV